MAGAVFWRWLSLTGLKPRSSASLLRRGGSGVGHYCSYTNAQVFADRYVSTRCRRMQRQRRCASNLRGFGSEFICLDMEADPSVDVVYAPGDTFPFPDGRFDLVITQSAFEHDPIFWMTIREMARVTKLSGIVKPQYPVSSALVYPWAYGAAALHAGRQLPFLLCRAGCGVLVRKTARASYPLEVFAAVLQVGGSPFG
jgi:hypothetical protein